MEEDIEAILLLTYFRLRDALIWILGFCLIAHKVLKALISQGLVS